jgi:hypothetical protein
MRPMLFNFLGYPFGRMYSTRTGKAYLGLRPSKNLCRRPRDLAPRAKRKRPYCICANSWAS